MLQFLPGLGMLILVVLSVCCTSDQQMNNGSGKSGRQFANTPPLTGQSQQMHSSNNESDSNEDESPSSDPPKSSTKPSVPQPYQPDKNTQSTVEKPLVDPGAIGPFKIASYSDGLDDVNYASAIIHYPLGLPPSTKLAATTLSGGYQMTKEQMFWLSERLASHGFVVLTFTPTKIGTLDPTFWSNGHKGAVAKLKFESDREGSPIRGMLDSSRIGISGFSMGGAGTIVAINEIGNSIKAAVPICAFKPEVVSSSTPTMFISGTEDGLASPQRIILSYESTKQGTPKSLVNIFNMRHNDVYKPPTQQRNISRYMISWYQVYLNEDSEYKKYLNGEPLKKDREAKIFNLESDFRYEP